MSVTADIANFQMSAPLLVWRGRSFKLGCLLNFLAVKSCVHLGRAAVSDNYGNWKPDLSKWSLILEFCWSNPWNRRSVTADCPLYYALRWCHEYLHITFPGNIFWCATPKLCSWRMIVINLLKGQCQIYRPEYDFRKSHLIKLLKSLTSYIYQRPSTM